ncbi:hypothetical protein [Nannocystis bainbridge]|uniref:NADH-quinone oxidoreductase subunit J n=1 Tax=Nannocystis bainbridge TaxID=2995303 RepID=A0ABT5E110_9BACT|nr:hypothetical protein [Nannocystis bainbridge]MDC0719524.1 hypothetical protein [Nannocystis bainbridge]
MTVAVFVALAAVALAAGVAAVWRAPAWALPVLACALAGVMLLYQATGLALVTIAAIVGAALVMAVARGPARVGAPADVAAPSGRLGAGRLAAVTVAVAGLLFVLVGTWARQFLWTGRELPPGSSWGELPGLGVALGGAPGLLGVGFVIVVAAAACAGPPRHRI